MSTKTPVSFYRVVPVTTPAAGAEWAMTVPGQGFWRVISIAWRLITDATVADRNVILVADDQTDTYIESRSSVDQAASLTTRYSAFAGASPGGFATTLVQLALPGEGLVLAPGHRLRSRTVNRQAGDAFDSIRALVQEFPMGPDVEWLPSATTQLAAMG